MLQRFTIGNGPVVPFSRHIGTGRAGRNPDRYKAWLDDAAVRMRVMHDGPAIEGPVAVRIVFTEHGFVFELGRSEHERPRGVRGDLDNLAKAVIDASALAGVMGNDRQVVELESWFRAD